MVVTPTTAAASRTVSLAALLRWLRDRWYPIVCGALAGLAVGLLITVSTPVTYRSTAIVLAPTEPRFLTVDVGLGTERPRPVTQDTDAALVRSAAVRTAADERLPGPPLTTDQIHVTVPTSTRALHISVSSTDPVAARRGAQVLAEEYTRVRNEHFTTRRDRSAQVLSDRRDSLRDELTRLRTAATGLAADSPARPAVRQRRADLAGHIVALDRATARLLTPSGTPAVIVRAAQPPRRPSRSNAEVPPISGLAGGALLGIGWARLWPRLSANTR